MPAWIVAIESSGEPLSIALSEDDRLQGLSVVAAPRAHDRMAAELIRRLLEDHNLEVPQLHAVAISAGPGSFTSLRIGASLAKGLCFGSSPLLVPVPTLEALAEAAAPVAQALRLRRIMACVPGHLTPTDSGTEGWLFVQEFNPDATPTQELQRYELSALRPSEDTLLCGPGAPLVAGGLHIPCLERLSAEWIATAGYRRYLQGIAAAPEEFAPIYGLEFQPREPSQRS
ncbi:MAG: tRNA (adenosine(37)-N6)-threonylcarbamoyltransferase complex dimerization subunit type 1 TsaB [Candidatus Kapabacteria bacterium]|nr:tRNA (adenosine(37)-N6)-threonylcarbamoyltransferase complex dimerization subunit type 1 TsaB [Candidatus Kapabacteria bacterium]MDW8224658.1 tRNA (adenosine(37)-N6)-threonylcarbamoyltransferase complex dimerization subunit type 1 TsaB [Bacteroidota bacterium]